MASDASKSATIIRFLSFILLILLPVSALGSRFGLWPFTLGLLILAASTIGGVILEVVSAIWLLRSPKPANKTLLRHTSLICIPAVLLFASALANPNRAPIHNISTDIDNPPVFVDAVALRGANSNPLEYSAEVAAIQCETYPDVKTLESSLSAADAFDRAVQTAESLGWEVHAKTATEGRIEAYETTFWFGFIDDVVIRITPTSNGGSAIDLRSVSRVGVSDLGANASRIGRFVEAFNRID